MAANLFLNIVLIKPLAHAGLALATSLASMINAILLVLLLLRQSAYKPQSHWALFLGRIIMANVVMGLAIAWFAGDLIHWLHWSMTQRIWHLVLSVLIGMAVYTISLLISGLRFRDLHP